MGIRSPVKASQAANLATSQVLFIANWSYGRESLVSFAGNRCGCDSPPSHGKPFILAKPTGWFTDVGTSPLTLFSAEKRLENIPSDSLGAWTKTIRRPFEIDSDLLNSRWHNSPFKGSSSRNRFYLEGLFTSMERDSERFDTDLNPRLSFHSLLSHFALLTSSSTLANRHPHQNNTMGAMFQDGAPNHPTEPILFTCEKETSNPSSTVGSRRPFRAAEF